MDDEPSFVDRLTSVRLGIIALVAGTLVFATERVWLTAVEGGVSLPLRSALGWWGANVGIALVVAICGGLSNILPSRLARSWLRLLVGASLFGVAGAATGAQLGETLGDGGWVGQQPWSPYLRYMPAMGLAAVFAALHLVVAGLRDCAPNALGVALIMCGVGAVCIDHVVLLGTYPDLHLTLHVAVIAMFCAGIAAINWRIQGRVPRAIGVASIAVAAIVPQLWTSMPMGYRPQLSLSSSMARVLMERTMPRITLDVAEREFAMIDMSKGRYLPEPRGDELLRNDWNVLFVIVDTLRADALWPSRADGGEAFSLLGDTPFLDEWLETAVVFEHAYSQSSATHCSMPPMFKSLDAHEDTLTIGTPLGEAMADTGRTSIAVVNNFFLEPRFVSSQSLLQGFDVVEVYHRSEQEQAVKLLDEALDRHGERFFLWAHLYAMHSPGYGDDGPQNSGTPQSRYRVSLKWLDAQMAQIVASLERRGLAENTVIVFASDHGESLGANRQLAHGTTVYEEEVRVPLAIKIPGVAPRVVHTTVGNIDIVPTLWDVLALAPEATHRGRSLLPAILGEPIADVPYYMENRAGDMIGVVIGDQKLIQMTKSGTTMRFDLNTDPTEDHNLFTEGPDDRALLRGLYARHPELVTPTAMMGEVAASLLDDADPDAPGAELPYVLDIAARSGVEAANDELDQLFAHTNAEQVKLQVVWAVQPLDPARASVLVAQELATVAPEREAGFVEGLAAIDAPPVDYAVVERRFGDRLPPDDVIRAWAMWMQRWEEPAVGTVLKAMIAARRPDADPLMLSAVADLVSIARLDETERSALLGFHRPLLEHPEARVRTAAMGAAAALRDREVFDRIARLAADSNVRVRQAALHALARLDGERAVEIIEAAGHDENLQLDAVRAMENTGSPRAVPFVERVAAHHPNSLIRALASKSLERLQERLRQ